MTCDINALHANAILTLALKQVGREFEQNTKNGDLAKAYLMLVDAANYVTGSRRPANVTEMQAELRVKVDAGV